MNSVQSHIPPDWLKPGQKVSSREYGVGKVLSLSGPRVVVNFKEGDSPLTRLLNWGTAVSTGELLPQEDAGMWPKVSLEEILQIPQDARAIALELAVAAVEVTPPTASERHQVPTDLPLALQTALNRIGINSLYSHQVEALECLRAGKDLSIATPTASGKTLCYNPAVFESCLSDCLSDRQCCW